MPKVEQRVLVTVKDAICFVKQPREILASCEPGSYFGALTKSAGLNAYPETTESKPCCRSHPSWSDVTWIIDRILWPGTEDEPAARRDVDRDRRHPGEYCDARSRANPRPVTLAFRAVDFCDSVDRWPRWATDQAPIRAQCRGILTMKFWLLRPKGFSYHYTDTESCWGCVVRAADRETALALAATSELRLGDDFPDGWDVMEVPVDGPPAVIMFDY
jgi:hypothetical protein